MNMAELTMNSERRLTTAGEGNTPLMGMSAFGIPGVDWTVWKEGWIEKWNRSL